MQISLFIDFRLVMLQKSRPFFAITNILLRRLFSSSKTRRIYLNLWGVSVIPRQACDPWLIDIDYDSRHVCCVVRRTYLQYMYISYLCQVCYIYSRGLSPSSRPVCSLRVYRIPTRFIRVSIRHMCEKDDMRDWDWGISDDLGMGSYLETGTSRLYPRHW